MSCLHKMNDLIAANKVESAAPDGAKLTFLSAASWMRRGVSLKVSYRCSKTSISHARGPRGICAVCLCKVSVHSPTQLSVLYRSPDKSHETSLSVVPYTLPLGTQARFTSNQVHLGTAAPEATINDGADSSKCAISSVTDPSGLSGMCAYFRPR
jgi:hypothetical protein